jgi:hypothetical protein
MTFAGFNLGASDLLLAFYRQQVRAAQDAEVAKARRRIERVMLGGCPCGEVTGEAHCVWCDGGLPEGLRDAGIALRRRDIARGKIDFDALVKKAAETVAMDLRTGPRNRRERRAERSRRAR